MTFHLEPLTLADEREVQKIVQDAFAAAPWNDDWQDDGVFHEYILDLMGNRNSVSLGLYEDEELVGVSLGRLKHWFNGVEYNIDDLCVKTACQGKGVGAKLVEAVKNYCETRGFRKITLLTDRTAPAYAFYRKNGFQEMENCVWFQLGR